MPNKKAASRKQYTMLKGIAEGTLPERGRLTKAVAAEMIVGQDPHRLPKTVADKRLSDKLLADMTKRFETSKGFKVLGNLHNEV